MRKKNFLAFVFSTSLNKYYVDLMNHCNCDLNSKMRGNFFKYLFTKRCERSESESLSIFGETKVHNILTLTTNK